MQDEITSVVSLPRNDPGKARLYRAGRKSLTPTLILPPQGGG